MTNVSFHNCFCPHVTLKKLMQRFTASAHSYVLLFFVFKVHYLYRYLAEESLDAHSVV